VGVVSALIVVMKINPVSPINGSLTPQRSQPIDNHRQDVEKPTEVAKTNHCGHSQSNGMSTKDMVQLIMAVQMVEKLNEITSNIIDKYLKG